MGDRSVSHQDLNPRHADYAGPSRSSVDLQYIASSRQFLSLLRERSIGILQGRPGLIFLPMDHEVLEEIIYLPELQEEWMEIIPLYYQAMLVSRGQSASFDLNALLRDASPRSGPSQSSENLEIISLSRILLGFYRDWSVGFILGLPGFTSIPMYYCPTEEIYRFPELRDEWEEIRPLYNYARAIYEGDVTRPYTQLTSPANIMTQAHEQPASPSVTPPATQNDRHLGAGLDDHIHEEHMEHEMNEAGVNVKQEESLSDSSVLKRED